MIGGKTMNGPFAIDTLLEVVHMDEAGQQNVAGYVFVSQGSGNIDQEQRWILYADYMPLPAGTVLLRLPPSSFQCTSLTGWQAAAPSLWRDSATYAKVASKFYDRIHDPVQLPPPYPTFGEESSVAAAGARPHGQGASRGHKKDIITAKQLVDRWQIQQPINKTIVDTGTAYGMPLEFNPASRVSTNLEYWVTLPVHVPVVTSGSVTESRLRKGYGSSLDDYLRQERDAWVRGSSFTISSCAYKDTLPSMP
jgi:hypothetical protein